MSLKGLATVLLHKTYFCKQFLYLNLLDTKLPSC